MYAIPSFYSACDFRNKTLRCIDLHLTRQTKVSINKHMNPYTCHGCGAIADVPLAYCSVCGGWYSYGAWPRKPHAGAIPDTALRTARDLARQSGTYLALAPEVEAVTGRLPCGLWGLVLYGPPGTGKSTTALLLADALCGATRRPVLYNSLEEGHSQALSERLRRLEVRREDIVFGALTDIARVIDEARAMSATAIIFDSWSYMRNVDSEDLARIQREAGASTVTVLHATKDGQHRGSMSLLHAADVVVELGGGRWRRVKSRFENVGEGELPWLIPPGIPVPSA